MHILETIKLSYIYPTGIKALDNVNFRVERAEIVGVIGANGAGKTTLFKHFNGLLKPTSGKILVRGEEITDENILQVRKTVGLVFQNPDDQLFAPTVFEDVAFGPRNLGLSEDVVEHRVKEALKLVGMKGFEDRAIHELSFGEKKRVAIAGVLAMEPLMLVLDEPTSGLDPDGVRQILRLMKSLKKKGFSVVFSTHDVDVVPEVADRVYLLHHGRVEAHGTAEEVFQRIDEAHLRLPYVAQLLREIRREGYPISIKLTVKDAKKELLRLLGGNTGCATQEKSSK